MSKIPRAAQKEGKEKNINRDKKKYPKNRVKRYVKIWK